MGGKARNVVNLTLSIPRELKEKMAAAKVTVGWSAVAAAAFRSKLAELGGGEEYDLQRENQELRETIERVRNIVGG